MTQEEKKLKDLCSRIPYGTKVCVPKLSDGVYELVGVRESEPGKYVAELRSSPKSMVAIPIDMVKPCYFSMASMTLEQRREWHSTMFREDYDILIPTPYSFDWLNRNHFDYLGLIDTEDAIDVTNLNIYTRYGEDNNKEL